MNGFWTSGPDRYVQGLRLEHARRRRELLNQMQAALADVDRDRVRQEIEALDRGYAERVSKIGRSLF